MADSRIACGPFEPKTTKKGNWVTFPLQLRADWINTDDGIALLSRSINAIMNSALFPDTIDVQYEGKSKAIISIKCDNAVELRTMLPQIEQNVLELTRATPVQASRGYKA